MKLNLFLSVLSVITVFHLCKAGPLRHLEKRAAFYIANETACVVDNVVYTSGDPIPTDDPCEACRCRPPGFACVLKECRVKPGCRAIRHVGQCCPEYICGCEHDGRFYQDGEAIRDPKNPCYECYCQGSSIACAFIDCIYRDECDSIFVPGECCPKYINCTRDIPDRNVFLGGNILPPINLLPTLSDESVLTDVLSTDEAANLPENPAISIQPQEPNVGTEMTISVPTGVVTPESSESEDGSSKSETVEPEILVTEEKKLITEVEEKDTKPQESSTEENQDLSKENEDKKTVESTEETKILLNSENGVSKGVVTESSEVQESDLKLLTEAEKELPQTTEESKSGEIITETDVTETVTVTELTNTEKEPQIKNSASENSKSLKLSDDDQLEKIQKEQQTIKPDKEKTVDTTTELAPESTSVMPTEDLKESSTMESKPEPEEKATEKSQTNPQDTPFYINNAKIKSESAETVTIVVHVKEGIKLATETDFIEETMTPVPVSNVSEENLMKSNDEIRSTSSTKESSESEDNTSTNANYEIFPTTMKISDIELSSKPQSTDQKSDNIQERSDEADNIALEAEENPISEEKELDSKSENNSQITTTTMGAIEVSKEARINEEITEGTEIDEPTSTIIKIDTSRPITIEIMTDSTSSPKPEKSATESVNLKIEELTEEKKPENEKAEEIVKETISEVREDPAKMEEKIEETTQDQSGEESTKKAEQSMEMEKMESTTVKEATTLEEKVQESVPTSTVSNPEMKSNDEIEEQKNEEKTNTEKTTEESKSERITESQNEETKEPQQTTIPSVDQ